MHKMNGSTTRSKATTASNHPSDSTHKWFDIPGPIRRLFDRFPLVTYEPNCLPQRARRHHDKHVLYIFSTSEDSSRTNWSCNPTCLKWQTYLIIRNIPFTIRTSNNHASPSGSLPFLLPANSISGVPQPQTITASKLAKWAAGTEDTSPKDAREGAYTALVDQNIRDAWLYYLYLEMDNFEAVAWPLYISSASSNTFVQAAIANQLQSAARDELLKYRPVLDRHDIYQAADRAFRSLATLLGEQKYFTSRDTPGYFDAAVFAYTHLLLDTSLRWKLSTLQDVLQQYPTLCRHRNALLAHCLER